MNIQKLSISRLHTIWTPSRFCTSECAKRKRLPNKKNSIIFFQFLSLPCGEMAKTIIVGAGQAGMALSYWLKKANVNHELLDALPRAGDNWRNRWDSLHMFSPVQYDGLPGMPFPGEKDHFPSKDEVADYLENYVAHFDLPLRKGVQVQTMQKTENGFLLSTDQGEMTADQVVIATGPYRNPFVPGFATEFNADIVQMHSKDYRNPASLPPGPVLVVGAGASGAQIALELSKDRKVYLSGRNVGYIPRRFLGKDAYWWFYKLGIMTLRRDSIIGKWVVGRGLNKGDAFIGRSLKSMLKEGGMIRRGKVTACKNGLPVFEGGAQTDDIKSVLWATGYRPNYKWIQLPVFDAEGYPRQKRGVVEEAPGLYFIGLKLLYRVNSSNMGGVGKDAEYLAQQIAASA